MKVVPSTNNKKLKSVIDPGMVEIYGDQAIVRRCFITAILPKKKNKKEVKDTLKRSPRGGYSL